MLHTKINTRPYDGYWNVQHLVINTDTNTTGCGDILERDGEPHSIGFLPCLLHRLSDGYEKLPALPISQALRSDLSIQAYATLVLLRCMPARFRHALTSHLLPLTSHLLGPHPVTGSACDCDACTLGIMKQRVSA